jgi:hypothetical protein
MKKLILLFVPVLIAAGCAPSHRGGLPAVSECAPTNLEAKSNDRTLSLKWNTNCPDDKLLSGYNIYLLESPLDSQYYTTTLPTKLKPYNHTPYPGDTDPASDYETMTITNLDNGREFFITVRTVFPDNSMTVSSNEVGIMCRPEGAFELAFRYSGLDDGFSFKSGESVRADSDENDIYFFHKDGFDFIASPKRLNGFIRDSKFYSLGKTEDIYQYPELTLDIPAVEKIPVIPGESYIVGTADGNYAKIRIEDAFGENKERRLKIYYIYQTVKGLMRF